MEDDRLIRRMNELDESIQALRESVDTLTDALLRQTEEVVEFDLDFELDDEKLN